MQTTLAARCRSLKVYEHRAVPTLTAAVGEPSVAQLQADADQLARIGLIIDESLKRCARPSLEWPPPGRTPPAIVTDLQDLYTWAVRSARLVDGAHRGRHVARVEPLREKACTLAAARWTPASANRVRNWLNGPRQPGRRIGPLGGAITATTVLVTLLQGPGAALDFGPDLQQLVEHVTKVYNDVVLWEGRHSVPTWAS